MFDTHLHIASNDIDQYQRQPIAMRSSTWWRDGAHEGSDLIAALDAAGVANALIVQAVGVYGFDNRYVLHAAAQYHERLAAVVAVDVESDDSANEVRRLAHGNVVGVRLFAVASDPTWPEVLRTWKTRAPLPRKRG